MKSLKSAMKHIKEAKINENHSRHHMHGHNQVCGTLENRIKRIMSKNRLKQTLENKKHVMFKDFQ